MLCYSSSGQAFFPVLSLVKEFEWQKVNGLDHPAAHLVRIVWE